MGKRNTAQSGSNLGKAIIRDRFRGNRNRGRNNETQLHTSELADGYDWGRLNLQSVTEQSQLDDFLATAELAGTEFIAEKLNVALVEPTQAIACTGKDIASKAQEEAPSWLRIPRRPGWTSGMTTEELVANERQAFLDWRRHMAILSEEHGLILTPFEKNLDFWRQLWRVVEKSDVVVQIVDSRHPLLFRCPDLEDYVKSISPHKVNLVLLNKADFLTQKQRSMWAKYFKSISLPVAFYSALKETEDQKKQRIRARNGQEQESEDEEEEYEEEEGSEEDLEDEEDLEEEDLQDEEHVEEEEKKKEDEKTDIPNVSDLSLKDEPQPTEEEDWMYSGRLLSSDDLVQLFRRLAAAAKPDWRREEEEKEDKEQRCVIGLVGYPNVGKSSTLNSLIHAKKAAVSATPGKTKHFQTFTLGSDMCLCDCPGLVMPSVLSSKHEMLVWGILSSDHMREPRGPAAIITQLVPRNILQDKYGLFLPPPPEDKPADTPPTADEFLNALAFFRGFMTVHGVPDQSRASRLLLKDFVQGRVLYCKAPPGSDAKEFQAVGHLLGQAREPAKKAPQPTDHQIRATRVNFGPSATSVDASFFGSKGVGAHSTGRAILPGTGVHSSHVQAHASFQRPRKGEGGEQVEKPWKKHNKGQKREKARRLYRHLDL